MARQAYRVLKPLERWGTAVENALLVLLLGAMMLLATAQIVLRLFFDAGIIWADELLKILVLWIALVGSVATSRNRRHLRIDLLSHYLPEHLARLPLVVVDAFAAAVCGVIAWHSARYLALAFGDTVLLGIPAWTVQGILPVAFGLMAWRFAVYALADALALLRSSGRRAGDG